MRKRITIFLSFCWIFHCLFCEKSLGYDDKHTHKDISNQAIKHNSNLDNFLKIHLGLNEGLDEILLPDTYDPILELLKRGSELEDDPVCRASNHFFNPLVEPWSMAYLTDDNDTILGWITVRAYCSIGGWSEDDRESNLTWATSYLNATEEKLYPPDPEKFPYNWKRARTKYYQALTAGDNQTRDKLFAETFETLGHVLHLLQDVSVPAHVHNDFTSHLIFNGVNHKDFMEWVKQPFEYHLAMATNRHLVTKFTQVTKPSFTKLTDFWDTNRYVEGGQPPETSSILTYGLAESTNANYFSDSTIPNNNPTSEHDFSYPQINSIDYQICEDVIPTVPPRKRRYISRTEKLEFHTCPPPEERKSDHFAAVSFLNMESETNENISNLQLYLDLAEVHETYAKELIPRAIGYSAALLDYFFRGTLEISPPDQYVYSICDGSAPSQNFTKIKAKVRNSTPGESISQGYLVAVAKYRAIPDFQWDLSNYPQNSADMESRMANVEFSYKVSVEHELTQNEIDGLNTNEGFEFTFDFPLNSIPPNITDLYLQVVFMGTLGNEVGAVAVGMKDLNEPMFIAMMNSDDGYYYQHQLLSAAEVNANDSLPSAAEIMDYDINAEISFFPTSGSYVDNHATFVLPASTYGRLIILTDEPQFKMRYNVIQSEYAPEEAVISGLKVQKENGVWQSSVPNNFRGIYFHHGVSYYVFSPDSVGIESAPWPDLSNTIPVPAESIIQ